MKRKASRDPCELEDEVQIASNVAIIDPDGDLQMDFDKNGELVGLLANKQILRLASPVFRTLLAKDSPFQESACRLTNKNGVQVIQFKDDEPSTMQIVMNVIHLQDHRVPRSIPFDQLNKIAELCDKYDLEKGLQSCGQMWTKPYLEHLEGGNVDRLLFIATALKLVDLFPPITKYIVMNARLMETGKLAMTGMGKVDFTEGVPDWYTHRIPGWVRPELNCTFRPFYIGRESKDGWMRNPGGQSRAGHYEWRERDGNTQGLGCSLVKNRLN